jgi:hypothetical protein
MHVRMHRALTHVSILPYVTDVRIARMHVGCSGMYCARMHGVMNVAYAGAAMHVLLYVCTF